jgi:site-specific recombinase XerD
MILGHAHVTTTQRYLDHLELEDLKRTVPALPAS